MKYLVLVTLLISACSPTHVPRKLLKPPPRWMGDEIGKIMVSKKGAVTLHLKSNMRNKSAAKDKCRHEVRREIAIWMKWTKSKVRWDEIRGSLTRVISTRIYDGPIFNRIVQYGFWYDKKNRTTHCLGVTLAKE